MFPIKNIQKHVTRKKIGIIVGLCQRGRYVLPAAQKLVQWQVRALRMLMFQGNPLETMVVR